MEVLFPFAAAWKEDQREADAGQENNASHQSVLLETTVRSTK
jgi:hypothetical protein